MYGGRRRGVAVTQLDVPFSDAAWTASLISSGACSRMMSSLAFDLVRLKCFTRIELEDLALDKAHERRDQL